MIVARPPAKELTDRELQVMHVFWRGGAMTAQEVRDDLAGQGLNLTYTTVATLVRILHDKGFVETTNSERPFRYQPKRAFGEVSRHLVADLLDRVFLGSREQLLLSLFDPHRLGQRERAALETILAELE